MAFSKTPTQDTYDTKRFPLVGMPLQRDGVEEMKDQRFLNCFPEAIKAQLSDAKKFYVKKRAGLRRLQAPAVGVARGMIYEETSQQLFLVIGSNLYAYNSVSLTLISSSIPGTGLVGFTVHLTTAILVVFLTGTTGWVIDPFSNTLTQITDPDFPNPHVPQPVSMDGYLFVAKANTADIYNSDVDNPFAWDPSNFIAAEMYPDNIVAMTKNNNYIVAVGSGSIEYFYDVGNPTGSPLARNDSAVQQFGTPCPNSVIQTEKEVCLVGQSQNGGRTIWVVEGFKAEEVGTEAIRMALNAAGSSIGLVNAFCVRIQGHKFYVIRVPTSSRTFVYDFDSKVWHEWSSNLGAGETTFLGYLSADSPSGYPYVLGSEGNSVLYLMDEGTYKDDTFDITMQLTTLKLDFDNMNRKDMYRASLFGDWPLDTTSTITLEWSDDDYRTWSNPRSIQLSTYLPVTRRLGKFRRRAFRLTHTGNVPVRLEGMEVDINNGVN